VLAAIVDEDILRYKRVKKKAYVRLVTNLGNLNLELHSDMVSSSSSSSTTVGSMPVGV